MRSAGSVRLGPRPIRRRPRAWPGCDEVLPWLAHDALVHYLSPRGLEQFTGGALGHPGRLPGTGRPADRARSVRRRCATWSCESSGPERSRRLAAVRSTSIRDEGSPRQKTPTVTSSSGRSSPLGDYLAATGDGDLLTPSAPVRRRRTGRPSRAACSTHVRRALDVIEPDVVPGTSLSRLRPRRLERLAATCRSRPRRPPVLHLDGDASGARPAHAGRRASAAPRDGPGASEAGGYADRAGAVADAGRWTTCADCS